MCWRAALTRSWLSRLEITSCMAIRVGGVRHKSQGFLDLAQPPRDTRAMDERELIYDWNRAGPAFDWSRARVDLNDETLRRPRDLPPSASTPRTGPSTASSKPRKKR